jgi:hypothetical protein
VTVIRLKRPANVAGAHHERGDVVDVDRDCADLMVDLDRAEIVEHNIEREVRAVPETAARTTARSRVRSSPREVRTERQPSRSED